MFSSAAATAITFRKELYGEKTTLTTYRPIEEQTIAREAVVARDVGNYKIAFNLVNELLKREPSDPAYHLLLGTIYVGMERWDEAWDSLNKSMQLDGKVIPFKGGTKVFNLPPGWQDIAQRNIPNVEECK